MHYAAHLALAAIAQDHQLAKMDGAMGRQYVIRMDDLLRVLRKRNLIAVHLHLPLKRTPVSKPSTRSPLPPLSTAAKTLPWLYVKSPWQLV
ncbi:hypothetical protein D3C79_906760 [compost metagenome]